MYHGFCDSPRADDPHGLFVTADALRAQLDLLRRRGFVALDLDGYLRARAGHAAPRRSFLVTVDDALTSFARIGAPILAEAGVPSVLFVPAGLMGRTSQWMPALPDEPISDAAELASLQQMGVELAVHSYDHPRMVGLDSDELYRQVVEARAVMASEFGSEPRAFAYPYGEFDEAARRAVERADYDIGFSVHDDAGRAAVSRVDVMAGDTVRTLRLKLLPGYRKLWRATGAVRPYVRAALAR